MWLSKKKYNEIVENIDNLSENINILNREMGTLSSKLNGLVNCHTLTRGEINPWTGERDFNFNHETQHTKVNTQEIEDITLQELASYVIDHKPIERKEKIEITKKFI